jgi:hypothetical protein
VKWIDEPKPDPYKENAARILTITWNMHGIIPDEISDLLISGAKHDIYAIGTQECMRSLRNSWFKP